MSSQVLLSNCYIDKHKPKIGLDKVIEEEANIIKKIEKTRPR